METFPKASVPSSHKGERLAFTCLRRCEGSTPRACWGQKVPSGLSTTLHGAGDTHIHIHTVLASEPVTARGSHGQVAASRPEGKQTHGSHEGGREGESAGAALRWTPASPTTDILLPSFLLVHKPEGAVFHAKLRARGQVPFQAQTLKA